MSVFYNKCFIKHVGQLKNDNFARLNQGLLKVLIPSTRDFNRLFLIKNLILCH